VVTGYQLVSTGFI